MNAKPFPRIFDLSPSAPLVLDHAAGVRVTVCSGTVWLTQYGDARDHVLRPGQSFAIEVAACVVMSGCDQARVSVALPAPASGAPQRRGWRWPLRWDRTAHELLSGRVRRLRLG